MADLKRLEDVKSSLQTAQAKIKLALKDAKEKLDHQKEIKNKANCEVMAARHRLSKLKALAGSNSLCNRCWGLFPTLNGFNCLWHNNYENCLNCGLSLSETYDLPPPTNADALNLAKSACKAAEAAIKGKRVDSLQLAGRTSSGSNSGFSHNTQDTGKTSQRKKLLVTEELQRAEKNLGKATKHQTATQSIIDQWTKYYDQHKKQRKKVEQALEDIEDQEQKILESKLNKLSGRKRKQAARNSFSECAICLEREKEIVFQCGHQCCSVCAPKISQCHTCRVSIRQKIKLHG
jgi:hypothetical protein